jgi:hypothetical protein
MEYIKWVEPRVELKFAGKKMTKRWGAEDDRR